MSLVARQEIVSLFALGTWELGMHEWLNREWTTNKPCPVTWADEGPTPDWRANEFSAKASSRFGNVLELLSRRHRNCCFAQGVKFWKACRISSSTIASCGFRMINNGFSVKITAPSAMFLIAKAPHPLPGEG